MNASAKLYTLNYDEAKTYLWASIFVACNLVLPHVFHLIPQGGIIFAPLSLVILIGAYKLGWKVGLIAALASPLVNHLLTGMPAWPVLVVMTFKLVVLALIAGFTAQHFKRVSWFLLIGVVLSSLIIGGLGELDRRYRSHHSGLHHRMARHPSTSCWRLFGVQIRIDRM